MASGMHPALKGAIDRQERQRANERIHGLFSGVVQPLRQFASKGQAGCLLQPTGESEPDDRGHGLAPSTWQGNLIDRSVVASTEEPMPVL